MTTDYRKTMAAVAALAGSQVPPPHITLPGPSWRAAPMSPARAKQRAKDKAARKARKAQRARSK